MASFTYTVDTNPMALEIGTVSRNLNNTTGAVVAMKTAVLAVENQAADHICDNLNRGFYALIRSQISQKMAKFKSDVDSYLMQLNQQMIALTSIKTRMERDYNMISARYTKLFTGLNTNLKVRIFTLDKPLTDFSVKEMDRLNSRTKYLTSVVPISQTESLALSQRILASSVRHSATLSIDLMKSFIHNLNVQKLVTDKILIEKNNLPLGDISIPSIILETSIANNNISSTEIYVSDSIGHSAVRHEIRNFLFNNVNSMNWRSSQGLSDLIKMELNKIADNNNLDERIRKNIDRMMLSTMPKIV